MKKILVVDDEPSVIESIKAVFDGELKVAGANGPAQAREEFKLKPDLVVLDLMFPGENIDGTDLCREFKAHPSTRTVPVLMLTLKAEMGRRINGLNAGADDYLAKPFDVDELRKKVYALLRMTGTPDASFQDPALA